MINLLEILCTPGNSNYGILADEEVVFHSRILMSCTWQLQSYSLTFFGDERFYTLVLSLKRCEFRIVWGIKSVSNEICVCISLSCICYVLHIYSNPAVETISIRYSPILKPGTFVIRSILEHNIEILLKTFWNLGIPN